jgi:hypothetical protein
VATAGCDYSVNQSSYDSIQAMAGAFFGPPSPPPHIPTQAAATVTLSLYKVKLQRLPRLPLYKLKLQRLSLVTRLKPNSGECSLDHRLYTKSKTDSLHKKQKLKKVRKHNPITLWAYEGGLGWLGIG